MGKGGCRGRLGGWKGMRGAMVRGGAAVGDAEDGQEGGGQWGGGNSMMDTTLTWPGWTYFSRVTPGFPASVYINPKQIQMYDRRQEFLACGSLPT